MYNNKIMKTILISILLVVLASSTVSPDPQMIFDIVGPFSETAFGCLVEQGYTSVIVRASSDTPGVIDPNAVQTLENAQAAGLATSIYIVVCPSTYFFNQMLAVVQTIPRALYQTIWFKSVQNYQGCSWQPFSGKPVTCPAVQVALGTMKNLGYSVGVFSTRKIWTAIFGDTCTLGSDGSIKLWYADYQTNGIVDPTKSSSDFTTYGGFGGFARPFLKQVGGTVKVTNLCNNPSWHALIDIDSIL